jgi:hypothetical protein
MNDNHDHDHDHGGGGSGGLPGAGDARFAAPAVEFPTEEQARKIFEILEIPMEPVDGMAPGDIAAHLAGALRGITGMWEVFATQSPHQDDFRDGFMSVHDGNLAEVLAALASVSLRAAEAAAGCKTLHESMLTPMTLAAATSEVACWAFALGAEIAKGCDDRDERSMSAVAQMMNLRLRVLFDQAAMLRQMMFLHAEVHHETGDCG